MCTFFQRKIIAIATLVHCYSDEHDPFFRGNKFIIVGTLSIVCIYRDTEDMKRGLFKNSKCVAIATLPHRYNNISIVSIETLGFLYSDGVTCLKYVYTNDASSL